MSTEAFAAAASNQSQDAAGKGRPYSQLRAVKISVFHGTRRSFAEEISKVGFAPISVADQLQAVAVDHDVALEDLLSDLETYGRFAILDPRPNSIYFVGDRDRAGSWADRAPEATWEALWAVYRIRHPQLGDDWWQSDEGHWWVLAQRLADPPVVVEANATLGALRYRRSESTAADLFRDRNAAGDSVDDTLERFMATPEWMADPQSVTYVGYQHLPTRVDPSLMRFMTGEDDDAFYVQLEAGRWGAPAGSHHGTIWYSFEDLCGRLSAARQSELEQIVGMKITWNPETPSSD